MNFKTQYSREVIFTEPGTPIKTNYLGKYNKFGSVVLQETGKDNLYAYIQSFADSVDLNVLIARFNNGDTSALNQRVGQYLDVSDAPKTLAEAFETVQKAADVFAVLPTDIKSKYNNNLGDFIADIGSDNFNELFNRKTEAVATDKVIDKVATVDVSNDKLDA